MAHNTKQSRTSKHSLQAIQAIYESPMGHMADPDLMIHFSNIFVSMPPTNASVALRFEFKNVCLQLWHKHGTLYTAPKNKSQNSQIWKPWGKKKALKTIIFVNKLQQSIWQCVIQIPSHLHMKLQMNNIWLEIKSAESHKVQAQATTCKLPEVNDSKKYTRLSPEKN